MSSKITYMVRPISVYTEFLQTEISQPKVLATATGHCHNYGSATFGKLAVILLFF